MIAASAATVLAACAPPEPLELRRIEPAIGSVTGGTRVTLEGAAFASDTVVDIGGIACSSLVIESSARLSCVTGDSALREGTFDVTVTRGAELVSLPGAFTYECPWTTSTGRRTCGAAPAHRFDPVMDPTFITQMQVGHGFVANPDGAGTSNLDDTSNFTLGDRSAYVETDGMGTPRTLSRLGGPAIDMRGQLLHAWLKVSEVTAATAIDVRLGDSGLANHFAFRLRSTQGQQWITDGEWVSFTVSWAPSNYAVVGAPDRGRITDISFRVVDDATGTRVRLAVNGLALVPEPVDHYPQGVVSFTFDDNYADMAEVAAPLLDAAKFPATAYIIVDHVDGARRASLDQLRALHERGWDIAVHSFTSVHHDARFPTLDAALVEDELVDSRAWLMTHGFTGFDHCAYPGGDYTYGGETPVLPIVDRYFTSCRTIYQRQRETFPPSHPHKLRVFYITSDTSLAAATAAVDHARAHREWLIFAFHSLVDTPPEVRTQWPRRDFAALVDHVVSCGMPVESVSRVLAR